MIGWIMMSAAAAVVVYTYALYPALLRLLPSRQGPSSDADPEQWPDISITIPVYNESRQIRDTIRSLLAIDYPADRRQILFVSDASSDGTDETIAEFAGQGIELLRMNERGGKTAAENAAHAHLRGEIIVNTDASIRIHPAAIKALVRRFRDPSVGVATGRDVSAAVGPDGNVGESGYVGYEMWVRDLETRTGGIVGASGSLYAIRRELHMDVVPAALSRDFASALIAREHGFRAVSVPDALCVVPRTHSLRREFRRKVRTMARGMETLWFKRHLLNPRTHGRFAWKLFSHKVCRWLVPWSFLLGLIGLIIVAIELPAARWLLAAAAVALAAGAIGWFWPDDRPMPRMFSVPAFALAANVAAIISSIKAMRGELNPIWEPTRREAPTPARST